MSRRDVAITGLGLITPAGTGVAAAWTGLCDGRPTADHHGDLTGLDVDYACAVEDLEPETRLGRRLARRLDRICQLALIAAQEAVRDSGHDPATWDGSRVGVVLGCAATGVHTWETAMERMCEGGPRKVSPVAITQYLPNMAAAEVSIALGAGGPSFTVASACASGASAVHLARELLLSGAADIMISGGSAAELTPLTVTCFDRLGALARRPDKPQTAARPFEADRNGFVMGEGASVLVLERAADARAREARSHATLVGCGVTDDCYHPTAPQPDGRGAERAVRLALADAGAGPSDVGHVNAHGTGTRLNDAVEARVLETVLPAGVPVTSIKGTIGHTLGAAGAVEAAAAALSLREGLIPPTANLDRQDPEIALDVVAGAPRRTPDGLVLSNSFGFGGHNVVLALAPA
ncbi:beta-ketoacyl-[acyl-carrier-protein] synthase family protein [Actinomadura rubrisoli]|uniref:Beta-ketoacyl-[acyl-carrier-protein] synthase family protein n=1 Tax=Actinomadura rubrisoli TaxID=2530368 RepID=A0A4R5CGF7_9ACTN|nr:beta-ketoacyl-[acyl-carrier-protein] synthase family protein [Actinomadura rubrisoli]TDD98139.1 beta-ketoacyl-[acyl-carrier-protein] synthase family protein [Actinomadura rubrisoli]